MQPVREFDGHDADVVTGGDEHLAERLGLGGGAVVDLLQLGDAVDEVGDLLAELLADLLEGHLGVLDRVVEEGGGQGRGLRAEFGEDEGDGERVGDVRLAALAELAPVGRLRQFVRPAQDGQVGLGVVRAVGVRDVADGVGQPVAAGGAEQCGAAESAQVDSGAAAPAAVALGLVASALMGHLRRRRPAVDECGAAALPVLDATEPTTRHGPALAQRERDHPFERGSGARGFAP